MRSPIPVAVAALISSIAMVAAADVPPINRPVRDPEAPAPAQPTAEKDRGCGAADGTLAAMMAAVAVVGATAALRRRTAAA